MCIYGHTLSLFKLFSTHKICQIQSNDHHSAILLSLALSGTRQTSAIKTKHTVYGALKYSNQIWTNRSKIHLRAPWSIVSSSALFCNLIRKTPHTSIKRCRQIKWIIFWIISVKYIHTHIYVCMWNDIYIYTGNYIFIYCENMYLHTQIYSDFNSTATLF